MTKQVFVTFILILSTHVFAHLLDKNHLSSSMMNELSDKDTGQRQTETPYLLNGPIVISGVVTKPALLAHIHP